MRFFLFLLVVALLAVGGYTYLRESRIKGLEREMTVLRERLSERESTIRQLSEWRQERQQFEKRIDGLHAVARNLRENIAELEKLLGASKPDASRSTEKRQPEKASAENDMPANPI